MLPRSTHAFFPFLVPNALPDLAMFDVLTSFFNENDMCFQSRVGD